MPTRSFRPKRRPRSLGEAIAPPDRERADATIREAKRESLARSVGYRERSLALHGWICGRCGREFDRANLHQLTVHHRDGNHENNPADGSNWENLCRDCHDAEHGARS